jgi:hypothetical protein
MCRPDRRLLMGIVAAAGALSATIDAAAQAPNGFGVCVPNIQRAGRDVGCFIMAEQPLGALGPGPVFWHVTRFSTRAAAERVRPPRGTVLEAYGHAWLLTIGDFSWRAMAGTHMAAIGPLPITPGTAYSALYMDASMRPGMKSAIHRHSGPEAWYTISGETCLETPSGTEIGRADARPVIVPAGRPMELTATGKELRRSLVLILHEASKPPTTAVTDWTPRGACRTP